MGKHKHSLRFELDGQFLGFLVKDGYKVKGVRLAIAGSELSIKLSKEARAACFPLPQLGVGMRVVGEQTIDERDGSVKYKARHVSIVSLDSLKPLPAFQPEVTPAIASFPNRSMREAVPQENQPKNSSKACILVCQKSDCCKKGGREVMAAIQQELEDRHLTDHVTVRGTGCMKQCKAGPALVMPDKSRHTRVRPGEVPKLVERHAEVVVPAFAR
ncbi:MULTISPECIES: (2Fe-2S) ferredoxin domain-containing protein [unclassified Leptolyngbya]|uniref:(2Fe-2S) ferredoxin domain-containing protein n=1 Tax=unclassified Leptolyngbya TaxID=2650499 RepID=UPI001683CEB9|nr:MULTISPECIES: (2Fe-2S) ferredoxin domain-containing protein [unclassified Leptolyngbya]MBD1910100.1 (2Fe-2S) ferredoxin domain-containing protein [Leptolyngbya sp. FACHB-8]MBD2156872.1 (2Fe-2S) ferredoxin domain-containing protein [Leptolyngbya sp. FACHB-16]